MESRKYYRSLDFIRIIACLAVLFYHLNILRGGFLAVCTFFVLSGYLSGVSAFKKEKFSIKDYYVSRFVHIYLPLLFVVLLTVCITSFIPSINWVNLKPETTSVLCGYNNYWQLSANQDYFTRTINSPFTHFWYISILLQFDLIFPIIYFILHRITVKNNRIVPCILLTGLSIISVLYFYYSSINGEKMVIYYDSILRSFSIILGLWLSYISVYFGRLIPKLLRNRIIKDMIFYAYLFVLIGMYIVIDSSSKIFAISMIISSLLTLRLIEYGTLEYEDGDSKSDKVLRYLALISYEIYLIQFPVIFFLQKINMNSYLRIGLILVIVLVLSVLLHYVLNKKARFKVLRYILGIIMILFSLFGAYKYIVHEDYSKEMRELQKQLEVNEELAMKKQEEYALKLEQAAKNKESIMKKYENSEKALAEEVTNLPIVGIGDSVMLGAVGNLYKQFPNGYFDAKISRTGWVAGGILRDLAYNDMLGEVVVLNLGTNGDCPERIKDEMMRTISGRLTFWITVTNDGDVHVNDSLKEYAEKYDNLYIIDWNAISKGHGEYFMADGIHLTETGRQAYTKAIYDAIYNVYLERLNNDKKQVLSEMEKSEKDKLIFYGNDLVLNGIDVIEKEFSSANFVTAKDYSYEDLIEALEKGIEEETLNNKIVIAFDKSEKISNDEYKKIIDMCKDYELYIILVDGKIESKSKNVHIIDFKKDLEDNKNYLMVDGIHLSKDGYEALLKKLNEVFS